ncbi:hypothetical protein FACS189450_07210 [Spirochaetia bacterium]|nr:hypothetical protein FACS189450_07210 [Spirochaetia bacterium]
MNLSSVLGSNGLQTLIMALTGSVALVIYFLNKRAEKREAAQIIVGEIRLAENTIKQIKNSKTITELSIILPHNTWDSKKYLFLNLGQDEFDLINDFYYKCTIAEQYRKMYYESQNNAVLVKSTYFQQKLMDVMYNTIVNKDVNYEEASKLLIEMANKEDRLFDPRKPINKIVEYIENITQITPTNAGAKIKKIGKVK